MRGTPSILVAYPSSFCLPGSIDLVEIKTPQLLLASYLARFFPVAYEDFELSIGRPNSPAQVRRFERRVRETLAGHPIDILALSCWSSVSYRATLATARIFRDLYPDRLIVVGGYHPSARPEEFCDSGHLIDYVVCGEGELALKQIAEGFPVHGRPPETTIVKAPAFPLEEFAPCNWDLVDSQVSELLPNGITNIFLYLSRGCPFSCSFCMEPLKEPGWRALSPDDAMREMRAAIDRFRPAAVAIADACFGLRPTWRKEFLRDLAAAHPTCWLIFETRPESIDPVDIELLSGLKVEVQFGVESGSPRILRLMNKAREPERFLSRFREVSAALSRCGVLHRANLIFNHPGETRETLLETFAFMDGMLTAEHSSLIWGGHGYMHFPGCELDRNRGRYEREFGTRFPAQDWWREELVRFDDALGTQPSDELCGPDTDLWKRMLKDRDQTLRSVLTPEAFNFAAWQYFPEWQHDPRYRKT